MARTMPQEMPPIQRIRLSSVCSATEPSLGDPEGLFLEVIKITGSKAAQAKRNLTPLYVKGPKDVPAFWATKAAPQITEVIKSSILLVVFLLMPQLY